MSALPPALGIYCPDLFVEQDLRVALERKGFETHAYVHPQNICSALFRDPDMLGLLVRPGVTAFASMTVREFRQADVKNPIIVLHDVVGDEAAKAQARAEILRAGADDVQPTDISTEELVARLKALPARGSYFDHQRVELPAGVVFDGRILTRADGSTIHLTPSEASLLDVLVRCRGGTVTKEAALTGMYGDADDAPMVKIIDVWVCKLRRKIVEATGELDVIRNVWGRGYAFCGDGFVPGTDDRRRAA